MSYQDTLPTPIGPLTVRANEQGVTSIYFDDPIDHINANAHTDLAIKELSAYFAGTLTHFTVPLAPSGTAFQKTVWHSLCQIKFGESASYGELAKQLGKPTAMRAVGSANGKNPISIIVPCHRVIGQSGKLTGYAGGLSRKAWLLEHEGIDFIR